MCDVAEWHAILHLMAHTQSQGWKCSSPKDAAQSHRVRASVEQEEKKSWLLRSQDDGSHIYSPYLASSSMPCTYHLPMTEMQRLTEVKWQFHFDHSTFLIYIWITLWLHRRNVWHKEKPKVRIHFSWTRKLSRSSPAMLFILQSHYSKWKWKLEPEAFVFEQRGGSRLWMFQM